MNKNVGNKKVLVALSGGIDSAVSAYLLIQQGYRVEAAFMKNWSATEGLLKNECPWLQDRQDALRVAAFLKIPFHTLNFEQEYQNTVMEYFFAEYQAGRTPNPDVMCNKEIKFKLLYDWAMSRGFDYLATGHYARIGKMEEGRGKKMLRNHPSPFIPGPYVLKRSVDEYKDQTYFIYNIKAEQLARILFPVGHLKKTAVKKMAQKIGLPNAGKKESMGLCFVGKIRLQDFLEQKFALKVGPIVDRDNNTIGQHNGLHNYTIGQRQGIQVGATGPYYVFKKDLPTNTLFVTHNPKDIRLETREVQIHSMNWISPLVTGKLVARFRHQGQLVISTVEPAGDDRCTVYFSQPQTAVASGQSVVLYKRDICLGGGIIV